MYDPESRWQVAIDPDKIADHALYAKNGETKSEDSLVSFAVIGNTWDSRAGPLPRLLARLRPG